MRGDDFAHPGSIFLRTWGAARYPPSVHKLPFLLWVFAFKQAIQVIFCDVQVADGKVPGEAFAGAAGYDGGAVGRVEAGAAFPQAGLGQVDEGTVHEGEFAQAGGFVFLCGLPELFPALVGLGVEADAGLRCVAHGAEVRGAVLRIGLGSRVAVQQAVNGVAVGDGCWQGMAKVVCSGVRHGWPPWWSAVGGFHRRASGRVPPVQSRRPAAGQGGCVANR